MAVRVAEQAFKTSWGLNASGTRRGDLLWKLGNLMDQNKDELAALEALDNGKTFTWAKNVEVAFATQTIKYYAGWADKIQGKVIEVRVLGVSSRDILTLAALRRTSRSSRIRGMSLSASSGRSSHGTSRSS